MDILDCGAVGAADAFGKDDLPAALTHASVSTHNPRAVTVLETARAHADRLCKSYRLEYVDASGLPAHHPTHPAGTWPAGVVPSVAGGRWCEAAKPGNVTAHFCGEQPVANLSDWPLLLDTLAQEPHKSLILGRLAERLRINQNRDGQWVAPTRNQKHYIDAPTQWFIADVDGLPVAYDVPSASDQDVESSIDALIASALPDFGGVSYVWKHTGSAGIKGGAEQLRVRLVFELEHAVSLRQQKRIIDRARATSPAAAVLDPGIYSAARLIFTAPPRLYASTEDGDVDVPRPVYGHARLVERDTDRVALQWVTTAATSPHGVAAELDRGAIIGTKKEVDELLAAVGAGPGSYHMNILRLIGSVACRTASAEAGPARRRLWAAVRARIIETSEPEHVERRLREHLNSVWWDKTWHEAVAWRRRLFDVTPPLPTPAIAAPGPKATIADVRASLAQRVAEAAAAIIGGERKHVLVKAPPGIGKTQALRGVVTLAHLTNRRIRLYAPTHELAAQTADDMKRWAGEMQPGPGELDVEQLVARIRHHKGRRQPGMCTDPTGRPLADRAESVGESPKKRACIECATGKAGACAWLAQDEDDGPGVIVQAHANLARDVSADADTTNLYIIDEGTEGTIVGVRRGGTMGTAIGDLDPGERAVFRKRRKGDAYSRGAAHAASAELRNNRLDLVTALRSALPTERHRSGILPASAVARFLADATWQAWECGTQGQRSGSRVDRALELEQQHRDALASEVMAARDENDRTRALQREHALSAEAARILEAIKASAKRERVFGIRVFRDGAGVERVTTSTRSILPEAIRVKGAIWLDGTANEDVWRAVISHVGTAVPAEAINADAPINAVRCVQYADRRYSRSALTGEQSGADEAAAAECESAAAQRYERAQLPWITAAGLDTSALEAEADQLRAAAGAYRQRGAARKMRSDAHLSTIWRLVLSKALPLAPGFQAALKRNDGSAGAYRVLFVAQKAVVERMRALGLPPNVACAHFGALRGLNAYDDVPVAVVVGRPAVSNDALELLTEALHMHNPAVRDIQRARAWGAIEREVETLAGRQMVATEAHPDPLCRALASTITEAEVRQAVARIRPYGRGWDKACEVHVFGQHAAGLPVSEFRTLEDTDRPWWRVALAAGAVFERPETNQAAYSGLVATRGRMSAGSTEQRQAWIDVLCQAVDTSTVADEMLADRHIEDRDQESGFPYSDPPTFRMDRLDGPDVPGIRVDVPGFYLPPDYQLVRFRVKPAAVNPRPSRQHAVLRTVGGKGLIERLLGRPVAEYEQLPASRAVQLLLRPLQKAVTEAAKGGDDPLAEHNAALANRCLKAGNPWPYAREVLGWPV